MKTCGGGGKAPPFLTSALNACEGPASRPCCGTRGERDPRTHLTGDYVGPRTGLDAVNTETSLSPAGNRTLAVQPVAHRSTD
jgi:hypothetical protein